MAINLNDNLFISAPKHADAKYMKFSAGVAQPYATSTEANTTILAPYRYQYLTVYAKMNGDPVEYWYRDGTADANLEPKNKESYTVNAATPINFAANYLYHTIIVIPTQNLANLTIGTTLGGLDIEPGTPVAANIPYLLYSPRFYSTPTTIYFGGLTTGTKILLYKTA